MRAKKEGHPEILFSKARIACVSREESLVEGMYRNFFIAPQPQALGGRSSGSVRKARGPSTDALLSGLGNEVLPVQVVAPEQLLQSLALHAACLGSLGDVSSVLL